MLLQLASVLAALLVAAMAQSLYPVALLADPLISTQLALLRAADILPVSPPTFAIAMMDTVQPTNLAMDATAPVGLLQVTLTASHELQLLTTAFWHPHVARILSATTLALALTLAPALETTSL
jgi:hypothetical protein